MNKFLIILLLQLTFIYSQDSTHNIDSSKVMTIDLLTVVDSTNYFDSLSSESKNGNTTSSSNKNWSFKLDHLIDIIGYLFVIISLRIGYKQIKRTMDDSIWQKRLASIEISRFTIPNDDIDFEFSELRSKYRDHAIPMSELDNILTEKNMSYLVTKFNYYDTIAVGIKTGIYDEEVIKSIKGHSITFDYQYFENLIAAFKRENKNAYVELENMYKRWMGTTIDFDFSKIKGS